MKKWFTPGLAIIFSIVNLPIVPKVITLVINSILALIALASTMFVYKYYGSLSMPNKTILTHLLQFSMYSSALNIIVFFFIIPYLIYFTPEVVKQGLMHVPDLTCSLLLPEPYFILGFIFTFAIIIFKSIARLLPTVYLNMNHEQVKTIALVMIITAWQLDICLILYKYGTICTDNMKYKIEAFYEIEINKMMIKSKPPLTVNHFIILFIPQTMSCIWKFMLFSIKICRRLFKYLCNLFNQLRVLKKECNHTNNSSNEMTRITKVSPHIEDVEVGGQIFEKEDNVVDNIQENDVTNDNDNKDLKPDRLNIGTEETFKSSTSKTVMILVKEKKSKVNDKKANYIGCNTNNGDEDNHANNELGIDLDSIECVSIETAINSVENNFVVSNNKPSSDSKQTITNILADNTSALRPEMPKADLTIGLGTFGSILLMAGNTSFID